MFDRYNTGINKENDNKVRNRGEITENTSIIRASVNEGVEQGEKKEFQCPKVSQKILSGIYAHCNFALLHEASCLREYCKF